MPDDPNQRPRDYGERIADHIHDEINARLDERMRRRRAKMDRRALRTEFRMSRPHSPFGGLVVGTILAGFGVLLLLDNLGIGIFDRIWEWWPAILIVAGAARIATACSWGSRVWGGALIFGGAIYLLNNLGIIHGNVWNFFWPVILIVIGLAMLARGFESGGMFTPMSSSAGFSSAAAAAIPTRWPPGPFSADRAAASTPRISKAARPSPSSAESTSTSPRPACKKKRFASKPTLCSAASISAFPKPGRWWCAEPVSSAAMKTKPGGAGTTDEKKPRLIVSGFAVFGGVVVKT